MSPGDEDARKPQHTTQSCEGEEEERVCAPHNIANFSLLVNINEGRMFRRIQTARS